MNNKIMNVKSKSKRGTKSREFSGYRIYWAEIRADKGVVTMSDQRKINRGKYERKTTETGFQ